MTYESSLARITLACPVGSEPYMVDLHRIPGKKEQAWAVTVRGRGDSPGVICMAVGSVRWVLSNTKHLRWRTRDSIFDPTEHEIDTATEVAHKALAFLEASGLGSLIEETLT